MFVVVVEYLLYGEVRCYFGDDIFYVVYLFWRNICFVEIEVGRNNFCFEDVVDVFGVEFVLEVLVFVGMF